MRRQDEVANLKNRERLKDTSLVIVVYEVILFSCTPRSTDTTNRLLLSISSSVLLQAIVCRLQPGRELQQKSSDQPSNLQKHRQLPG